MKNFQYVALSAALLLAPAFVLAEEVETPVTTGTAAKSERPRPPVAPGQILKNIRESASTMRATMTNLKLDVKKFAGEKRDDIKARFASSTPEDRQQMREETRAIVENKREEVRAKIDAAKEIARQKFGEAVQRSVGNIVDNLTKHIDKLGEIATRIDLRISELQTKGIPMDSTIALLAVARADIAAVQDNITAVGAALSAALASATPKAEMPKVRAAVKATEDAIHAAKDSLKDTLDSIRASTISQ